MTNIDKDLYAPMRKAMMDIMSNDAELMALVKRIYEVGEIDNQEPDGMTIRFAGIRSEYKAGSEWCAQEINGSLILHNTDSSLQYLMSAMARIRSLLNRNAINNNMEMQIMPGVWAHISSFRIATEEINRLDGDGLGEGIMRYRAVIEIK